jgi:hypothetical protein
MNDNDRKFGTEEVLKECWHEAEKGMPPHGFKFRGCVKCGDFAKPHRTFTTPDDAYALEQALVRDGLAGKFDRYCDGYLGVYVSRSPEQRCQVIIDFYKEQR